MVAPEHPALQVRLPTAPLFRVPRQVLSAAANPGVAVKVTFR